MEPELVELLITIVRKVVIIQPEKKFVFFLIDRKDHTLFQFFFKIAIVVHMTLNFLPINPAEREAPLFEQTCDSLQASLCLPVD